VPYFSALTWRIIAFNAIALIVLTAGVVLVQMSGRGLVEERLNGVQLQTAIVAGTLAQYATDTDTYTLRIEEAEPLLRQLIAPTRLRARLYLPSGRLAVDTRTLLARNDVQVQDLPALDAWSSFKDWSQRLYDGVMGVHPFTKLAPYSEGGDDGRVYQEVNDALAGNIASAERVDDQNKLVLSVAAPLQQKPFRAIYGVLLVSTESGDIDDILRQERATLIEVVAVAFLAMLLSSRRPTRCDPARRAAASCPIFPNAPTKSATWRTA
jgi:two-component system sensor histidine kinase ChvG